MNCAHNTEQSRPIYTRVFMAAVSFNSIENFGAGVTMNNRGFCLEYTQIPCT